MEALEEEDPSDVPLSWEGVEEGEVPLDASDAVSVLHGISLQYL